MTVPLTVLMPVYNAAPYVGEAIQSILSQSYKDFEFLIIENGSTDPSLEVIHRFKDSRIRVIHLDQNVGPPPALNIGLKQITAKYVARMDADDVALPGRLEAQIHFLETHPEFVLVGTQYKVMDAKGRTTWATPLPVTQNDIRWKLMFNSPFVHSSVVMRTEVVREFVGYDERFRYSSDFDLWSRLIRKNYKMTNLSKIYLLNRKHKNQDGFHAGIQKLLEEAARICLKNIVGFTGIDVGLEEILDLQKLLACQIVCSPQDGSKSLTLFNKIAKGYGGKRSKFYYRTLLRLGLYAKQLPLTVRCFLVLKNTFPYWVQSK